jgi:hypothetical protein
MISGTKTSTTSSVCICVICSKTTDLTVQKGKFILNNYKQALKIIADHTPEIVEYSRTFRYGADDFAAWRVEELAYLRSLTREPEDDVLAMSYVEALRDLELAE